MRTVIDSKFSFLLLFLGFYRILSHFVMKTPFGAGRHAFVHMSFSTGDVHCDSTVTFFSTTGLWLLCESNALLTLLLIKNHLSAGTACFSNNLPVIRFTISASVLALRRAVNTKFLISYCTCHIYTF